MTQITRFMTAATLEKTLGWEQGCVSPVAWLVIQEMAGGRQAKQIAEALDVSPEDLDAMCMEITGEPLTGERWRDAVMLTRSVGVLNLQTAATGWDSIEAMAVNRLGEALNRLGDTLDPMKALEIATAANKAVRRHAGEGMGSRTSIRVGGGAGNGNDLDLEIKSGNLGSVRLSLSPRVRAQLETPRTIEGDVTQREQKEMLSLDETRNLATGT